MNKVILIHPILTPDGRQFDPNDAHGLMERIFEHGTNGGWKYKDASLQTAHDQRLAAAKLESEPVSGQLSQKDAAKSDTDTGITKDTGEKAGNSQSGKV